MVYYHREGGDPPSELDFRLRGNDVGDFTILGGKDVRWAMLETYRGNQSED